MPSDESQPLRELHRIVNGACRDCAKRYTAHEAVWNIALGFKNAPRCLACLAARLQREPAELTEQLTRYVHDRDCYLAAWQAADQMEGEQAPKSRDQFSGAATAREREAPHPPPNGRGSFAADEEADAEWDAGELGCGELVMQLRIRLNKLPAGGVFQVVALDPAAPEDLPAWCRLTGHTLLSAQHPLYRIRKKGDADGR